jgi:hypothetical protein
MKSNRSLAISSCLQDFRTANVIGHLQSVFPEQIFEKLDLTNTRERLFPINRTLLTMVLTATQSDKTLQNSVDLFYTIHQREKEKAILELSALKRAEKERDLSNPAKKAGRPKTYGVKLPRSLTANISLNTAAYSKARERVPFSLVSDLFDNSKIAAAENGYSHWHGHKVFIADGTYVQLQDTAEISRQYPKKAGTGQSQGYPQALLQVLIERGSGQISNYKLGSRKVSELSLFYDLLDTMEPGSLVLADDLYNCYEVLAKCTRLNIAVVVAAKRDRNYTVVQKLAEGDEIVEIKAPKNRSKWCAERERARPLKVRMIQCESPEGTGYALLTTVVGNSIKKEEFQLLYLTRWDIEISIREVKTIMDINVLRAKTPGMALKELVVSLATYNLIRKIIYDSIKNMPFSPQEDFIYKLYKASQGLLIDKKGRVYNRWSPGRNGNTGADT